MSTIPDEYMELDPSELNTTDRRTYENQVRFLEVFEKAGIITKASKATNVHRETVRLWQRSNRFGFTDRFKAAEEVHREGLEECLLDRLKEPNCPPLLMIFALNAAWPEKYRPNVQPADTETVANTLKALRDAAQNRSKDASDSLSAEGQPSAERAFLDSLSPNNSG